MASFVDRVNKGLHRDGVTAADKLAGVTVTAADNATIVGVMANAEHKCAISPGNRYGSALPGTPATVTPTLNKTVDISAPYSPGAEWHDVFFSTDAAPLWLGRITEAQRIAGCAITAVGTVGAGGGAGTKQVETITVTHGADKAGTITVTLASTLLGTRTYYVALAATDDTVNEVATAIRAALNADATLLTEFTVGGTNAAVSVTAVHANTNDTALAFALANDGDTGVTVGASANTTGGVAGVCQVETATIVGTITTAGTCTVTFTSALLDDELVVHVALAEGDEAADVAGKIVAYIAAMDICDYYTIEADGADIVMTALTAAANDDTLNIAYTNGNCEGLTPDAASADTTAGVAPVCQVETITVATGAARANTLGFTVTTAGMTGSPHTAQVPLTVNHSTAALVAAEIRRVLEDDAVITAFFAVSGTGADIVLTALADAANDGTMAMALSNNGSTGVTVGASANTTAGVAPIVNVRLVGTGVATSADPFKFNNAYRMGNATEVPCKGYKRADIYAFMTVSDLRSAPSLVITPFIKIGTSGDFAQLAAQTITLLTAGGKPLSQVVQIDLNGAESLKVLVDTIAGQGASVDIYVELS